MNKVEAYAEAMLPLAQALKDMTAERDELKKDLIFVERWANHHGTKSCHSAESILGVIQHYPTIKAITKSYADGVLPTTPDPYAELAQLEREMVAATIRIDNDAIELERISALADKWNFECDEMREDNKRLAAELERIKGQEPVAYLYHDATSAKQANSLMNSTLLVLAADRAPNHRNETPLFLAAGAQERKPLTYEQIVWVTESISLDSGCFLRIARAIEKAHGIKGSHEDHL